MRRHKSQRALSLSLSSCSLAACVLCRRDKIKQAQSMFNPEVQSCPRPFLSRAIEPCVCVHAANWPDPASRR